MPDLVPPFDQAVPAGGYAWWYVDALDPEGRFGLALIGFVGSVFSPYYAWARRRGAADPLDHCSLNVGLYGPRHHWTMTERGRASVARTPGELAIGPSAMRWDGSSLRIDIDEITAPLPRRIRGTIRLHPRVTVDRYFTLEASGRHRWRPYMPLADVEVDLTSPPLRWRGTGYCDFNAGAEPLEDAFFDWQWTRTHLPGGRTAVSYNARPRIGTPTSLNLRMDRDSIFVSDAPRPRVALPRTAWGLERYATVDPGTAARVLRRMENGPFYARSLLGATLDGGPVLAVHETLSLDRFAAAWVQAMLPFRMPRNSGARRRAGTDPAGRTG
jgi:carotenoid 1,2-hydratase